MAGEIVNMEKLAEAQEAADTAIEAAMLAAEVVNDLILEGVHHILKSATEGLMARDLGHFLQPQAHRPVRVQHAGHQGGGPVSARVR